MKRNVEKNSISVHDWITRIVVKTSDLSVYNAEIRKQYLSEHKANTRALSQPPPMWISKIVSKLVLALPLDLIIQRRFLSCELKESFLKYEMVCNDVNVFLKIKLANEVPEKMKSLPGKMQKMGHVLQKEILQLHPNQEWNLEMMSSKYGDVNRKILLAVKHLKDHLSSHGIKIDFEDEGKDDSKKRKLIELQPDVNPNCTKRKPIRVEPKLSEIEKIRQRNIAEREKLFQDLKISQMKSEIPNDLMK